jgi:thiosulfate dehydrogenase
MESKQKNNFFDLTNLIRFSMYAVLLLPLVLLYTLYDFYNVPSKGTKQATDPVKKTIGVSMWRPMTNDAMVHEPEPNLVRYGKELIANTALYLGPKGKVANISNGMNCQNCHLDAGARPWGNNYGAVLSTYPKFRARSGSIETIEKRVNDCFERSLNGKALDSSSKEMRAIVSYITFLGRFVEKDSIPKGTGIWKLPYLKRAADPIRGQLVYTEKCQSCHGQTGEGIKSPDGVTFTYPPLWGQHSYNQGAGLFRLSRLAGYIKTNMPFGATYDRPQVSDEDAWDVAAYINTRPRPSKDISKDWPDISKKPVDHPFGPYADPFSEDQHKMGPFKPIDAFQKSKVNSK